MIEVAAGFDSDGSYGNGRWPAVVHGKRVTEFNARAGCQEWRQIGRYLAG